MGAEAFSEGIQPAHEGRGQKNKNGKLTFLLPSPLLPAAR